MGLFTALGEGQSHVTVSTLVTIECYKCHTIFAMTEDLRRRALNDRSIDFYCPNGHSQCYTKDRVMILEEKLAAERAAKERAWEEERRLRKERDHHWTERKKVQTRIKNLKHRVKNGVCPCCHRHFRDLQRHMGTKHPHYGGDDK